ncbi:hypothetical protein O181_003096 [Austropuccinia psidii MF-1]|uniref:Uncharacterized protein n=1 Tax=Austropuccinia psidii MF-1 TaxID=1389203 RepID=A0A9Q3BD64_9BASI|nr:hypothetical protein [Austropuccinia psidii MF-1]
MSKARNFKNLEGLFSKDHLMGLIIKQATQSQPEINNALMGRLEVLLSTYEKTPNLGKVIGALEACTWQDKASNKQTNPTPTPQTMDFNHLNIQRELGNSKTGGKFAEDAVDPVAFLAIIRVTCHLCKQPGHFARNCPKSMKLTQPTCGANNHFQAYYPILETSNMNPTAILTMTPSTAANQYQPQYQQLTVKACFVEMGSKEPNIDVLHTDISGMDTFTGNSVCDSSASHSLMGNLSSLYCYHKLTKTIPLFVATKRAGRRSYIEGMDSLIFKGEDSKTIIINRVFYSPDAACTLISPAVLIRSGASISTDDNDILICNGSKLPVLHAHLCQLKLKWEMPPYLPKIMGQQWTYDRKQLPQQPFSDKASKGIMQNSETCQHCCIAKSRQSSVLARHNKIVEPMDIVTANLMGNFEDAIPYGGKYALTIPDIGSTYGECHILTKKSDATLVLLQVLTMLETKTVKRTKTFCSDNGGKFCSSTLEDWCRLRGTVHKKSLPYHHEQNRSIEQYNREIADMGRALLHKYGLLREFWGVAFMWTSHIQNLILNSLMKGQAPMELLFHEKPCYNQMRLFSELEYIHIPCENRRKLDDQEIGGHVVMYLGHRKGWLFYLPSSKSLTTSAWAEFPKLDDTKR